MDFDVIIIGAGASGMMCGMQAGYRARRVLVLDHAKKVGSKILISGGGRCNFTNTGASAARYVSRNPHFCKSALSRFPADRFIEMVRNHGIAFEERKWGQLFCENSASEIVDLMKTGCEQAGVQFQLDAKIEKVSRSGERYEVQTSQGVFTCASLCVATGGLSIPKIGASGLGYDIARQFGLKIVKPEPALDGFTLTPNTPESRVFLDLAGISLECIVTCNGISFREDLLFTHQGLSGPAALQASLHWNSGDAIEIDLVPEWPDRRLLDWFLKEKKKGNRALVKNLLGEIIPGRLADRLCELFISSGQAQLPLPQVSEKALETFCERLHHWKVIPSGTVGYSKAEVTRGGVDTDELSSKTMEAKKVPGLYFIGEVVDVTGWLGGYNFQWAWASGFAAGQAV